MPSKQEQAWIDYAKGVHPRYKSFIDIIEKGGRSTPYFNAEGIKLALTDDHRMQGAKITMHPPEIEVVRDWLIVKVGITSEIYGTFYGTASADLKAQKGAEGEYPVEYAETMALRRALDHMGYTFHNPWLRGEVGSAVKVENQAEQADMQNVVGKKIEDLADAIANTTKSIDADDVWTALGLISFTDQAELDREIRHQENADKLTPKVFGAMVRALREEAGLSEQECRDHIKPKLARDLNLEEQLELIYWIKDELIDWIKDHRQVEAEESDEIDESIEKMIAWYSEKFGAPKHGIIRRMVAYENRSTGSSHTSIQTMPLDSIQVILKNDDAMKQIVEEAKADG